MPTDQQIEAAAKAMMQHGLPHYRPTMGSDELMARVRSLARVALQAVEQHDIRKVLVHRTAGRRIENAKAAFERRFGKSLMPLVAVRFQDPEGRECVKLTDTESGTWAEFTICNKRIKRLREHDEAAT